MSPSIFCLTLLALQPVTHGKATCSSCGPRDLGCHVWMATQVTETVYDITYKTETKKIRRPIIKEIRQPVSCAVGKPVDRTVLHEDLIDHYERRLGQTDVEFHKEGCEAKTHGGHCTDKTCPAASEHAPYPTSCLVKTKANVQFPALEWEKIAVEDRHNEIYYVRDWEEVEVTLSRPVKTPRTITRTVWKKVPHVEPAASCEHGPTAQAASPTSTVAKSNVTEKTSAKVEPAKAQIAPAASATKPVRTASVAPRQRTLMDLVTGDSGRTRR